MVHLAKASAMTRSVNQPGDMTALLRSISAVPDANHTCWVSHYCYLPTRLEAGGIAALVATAGPNLKIFRETVLLSAEVEAVPSSSARQQTQIRSVLAVQRATKPAGRCAGYGDRLSRSMPDWYRTTDSSQFIKTVRQFVAPVFMDTSYNGELLVLSGAPYLQGIDEEFDGDVRGATLPIGNDTIGQSFTMTFQVHLSASPVPQHDERYPAMDPGWDPQPFRKSPAIHTPTQRLNWTSLWSRRRSYHAMSATGGDGGIGMNPPPDSWGNVTVGDVSLMAWPDYYYGYIFSAKVATAATVGTNSWVGGYDLKSIEGAERYSFGAYRKYRNAAPPRWANCTSLNSSYMGTCTGLTKLPYIRDGRRSVGLDDFVISEQFAATTRQPADCIALIGHGVDIWGHRMMQHPIDGAECAEGDHVCNAYPDYMRGERSLSPFCAPLRALTNARVANLVLAGYTMAQSFMVNSAFRMHPEEFQIGVGAGAAAAYMARTNLTSTASALEPVAVAAIQARILQYAPLEWGGLPPPLPPHRWPGAVGFVCAATLARCVEVPGGGRYNANNTMRGCSAHDNGGCAALGTGEWLALAGAVRYEPTTHVATFTAQTRIKKSSINSSLQPSTNVVAVAEGHRAVLRAAVSAPFQVDQYEYVLLRCVRSQCDIS